MATPRPSPIKQVIAVNRDRSALETRAGTVVRDVFRALGPVAVRAFLRGGGRAMDAFERHLAHVTGNLLELSTLRGYRRVEMDVLAGRRLRGFQGLLEDDLTFLRRIVELTPESLVRLRDDVDEFSVAFSRRLTGSLTRRLDLAVASAVEAGLTLEKATSTISRAVPTPKIRFLETELRTQMQLGYSVGREMGLTEVEDEIFSQTYVAIRDDRVRPQHLIRDGVTRARSDPWWSFNTPPLGYNCRCMVIANFDEAQMTDLPPSQAGVKRTGKLDRIRITDLNDPAVEGVVDSEIVSPWTVDKRGLFSAVQRAVAA